MISFVLRVFGTDDTEEKPQDTRQSSRSGKGLNCRTWTRASLAERDLRAFRRLQREYLPSFRFEESIVRELFAAERAAYLGVIRNAIMQYDGDPCDAFAAGTRAALQYQAKNPGPFGRLIAEFSDSEWLRRNVDLWLAVASEEESPVIAWAAEHFRSGALPRLPPAFYQAAMLGPTDLLSRAHRQGRLAGDIEELGDDLAEFVSAGLKSLRDRQREA